MGAVSRARRSTAGYTLVEAMVAMIVFLVGVLGVAGLLLVVVHANRDATNRTRAGQLVHEKIEELASVPFSALTGGADARTVGGVVFDRAWTVVPDTPIDRVARIEVEARWTERGRAFEVSSATYRSP